MYAVSLVGVAPVLQRGLQFFRSKWTSFLLEFENHKAMMPVCYNGCEKVWTNWQTHTDL